MPVVQRTTRPACARARAQARAWRVGRCWEVCVCGCVRGRSRRRCVFQRPPHRENHSTDRYGDSEAVHGYRGRGKWECEWQHAVVEFDVRREAAAQARAGGARREARRQRGCAREGGARRVPRAAPREAGCRGHGGGGAQCSHRGREEGARRGAERGARGGASCVDALPRAERQAVRRVRVRVRLRWRCAHSRLDACAAGLRASLTSSKSAPRGRARPSSPSARSTPPRSRTRPLASRRRARRWLPTAPPRSTRSGSSAVHSTSSTSAAAAPSPSSTRYEVGVPRAWPDSQPASLCHASSGSRRRSASTPPSRSASSRTSSARACRRRTWASPRALARD
jgi:hypothetical protein